MKQIQPVSLWYNGQMIEATNLNAYVINDNLQDTASFWWGLYSEGDEPGTTSKCVASGNLSMIGQDYIDWNNDTDINDAAYTWISEQLGLTII